MPISTPLRAMGQALRAAPKVSRLISIATTRRVSNTTNVRIASVAVKNAPVHPITNFKIDDPGAGAHNPSKLAPFEMACIQAVGRHLDHWDAFAAMAKKEIENSKISESQTKEEGGNKDKKESENKDTNDNESENKETATSITDTTSTTSTTVASSGAGAKASEAKDGARDTLETIQTSVFMMVFVGVSTYAYLVAIHDRSTDEYLEAGLWKPPTL